MKTALVLAVTILVMMMTTATSNATMTPPCAIDEDGNCIAGTNGDGYDSESAWEYGDTGDMSWGRCKTVHAQRNYDSIYGFNIYHYYQQVTWCWSGGSIVYLNRSRWTSGVAPLWHFDGHIGTNCNVNEDCSGRTGLVYTTVWTQGQYHTCAIYDWVCNYKYPMVSISVNGYGGWTSATSG